MPYEYEGGFGSTIVPDTTSTLTPLPGHKDGAFPRIHLTSGESILWESKPALLPYIIRPIIYGVVGFIIGLILGQGEEALAYLIWIVVAIGVPLAVAAGVIGRSRTSFALTNRRIMTQYGVFSQKFADCGHDKVQNSTLIRTLIDRMCGWGSVMFSTSGTMGGIKTRHAKKIMSSGGAVLWLHVKKPIPVYKYAQETMESSKRLAKAQDYHLMAGILRKENSAAPFDEPSRSYSTESSETHYCTNCGKGMKTSWKFCRHCGAKPD